jgi:hypothetical protein
MMDADRMAAPMPVVRSAARPSMAAWWRAAPAPSPASPAGRSHLRLAKEECHVNIPGRAPEFIADVADGVNGDLAA